MKNFTKITMLVMLTLFTLSAKAKSGKLGKSKEAKKNTTTHFANGTIGNYVWRDINGDGLNNEPAVAGINNVRVELYKETSPGSNIFNFDSFITTDNDANGKPGYYLFTVTVTAKYKVKFPMVVTGVGLTTQTSTVAIDNNSDASTTDGFSPAFTITVTGTGVALNNLTIDAGYYCNSPITTMNYSLNVGEMVPLGEGLKRVQSNCEYIAPVTIQIPIHITAQPLNDDNSNPSFLGTATMPALPAGTGIISASIRINNVRPKTGSGSWGSEVRINLSGAMIHLGGQGIGSSNNSNPFDYLNNITNLSGISPNGGLINLFYYETSNDVAGPDAVFPAGSPAPNAFITITYGSGDENDAYWYLSQFGEETPLTPDAVFNPVGWPNSGIDNTNTAGSFLFYAGCGGGNRCRQPAIFTILPLCADANALGGKIFIDEDNNGVKDASEVTGLGGIKVIAINSAGIKIDSAVSSNNGVYFLSRVSPSDGQVMVKFIQSTFPNNFALGKTGPNNKTDVQLVTAPNCNVDLGMISTIFNVSTCSNNPDIVVAKFQAGTSNSSNIIVKFPYLSSGQGTPPSTLNSPGSDLGAIWGLAYQAGSNKLFSSAVMRRNTSFGGNNGYRGTGAIYMTDIASNTSDFYLDLNFFAGIDLGTDPHNYSNLLNDQVTSGKNPFDAVGKVSFGDLEISSNGKYLFAVNLNQRKIHKIFINNPAVPGSDITDTDITTFDVPNPGCTGGTYRPWALKYFNNLLYVGVVCDGSGGALGAGTNQFGYVYQMDPNTGAAVQVLSFPLNYKKGYGFFDPGATYPNDGRWNNWIGNWSSCSPRPAEGVGVITYPQPILSGIEIDLNGDMIISLLDRWSMQGITGYTDPFGQYAPRASDCAPNLFGYVPIAGGDLLRAGKCSTGNTWSIENNARVCSGTPTAGANNGEGPGTAPNNGEFYYQESFARAGDGYTVHQETSLGAVTLLPGKGEVLANVFDPLDLYSNGVSRFSNTTGARVSAYEITPMNSGNPFGKTGALGDIELLCDASFSPPQPIRIGNKLWIDSDLDGVQDANELPLPGVALSLWRNGAQIASITTNSNGEFIFSSATSGGGVVWTGTGADTAVRPNTAYEIRMAMAQAPLTNYLLATANSTTNLGDDQTDSDALLVTTFTAATTTGVISFTTGTAGVSNYTNDFGVRSATVVPITFVNISAAKQDQAIAVNWQVGVESNISHYIVEKSTNGINFTAIGTVTANNSAQYKLLDVAPVSGRNYYRIKAVELNNTNKFSNTISVLNSAKATVQIIPNPAKENISINGLNGQAAITIFSIDGKVMHRRNTNALTLSQSFDVSDFANGKYFVQIITDAGVVTKQFQVLK